MSQEISCWSCERVGSSLQLLLVVSGSCPGQVDLQVQSGLPLLALDAQQVRRLSPEAWNPDDSKGCLDPGHLLHHHLLLHAGNASHHHLASHSEHGCKGSKHIRQGRDWRQLRPERHK
eukprot:GFUD01001888.1.p1 GENE.GFUD01001888.1~~GFUD01001888.1.p1  ORF type:complete len:118 (+),score=19.22 GFUD01001888.1:3843-4196(+)